MNILDNLKVREYFGCYREYNFLPHNQEECLALRVLFAMQEPIRKGELTLSIDLDDRQWKVMPCEYDFDGTQIHSGWLRFPHRFQKKECGLLQKTCRDCNEIHFYKKVEPDRSQSAPEKCDHRTCTNHGVIRPSDAVEELRKEIHQIYGESQGHFNCEDSSCYLNILTAKLVTAARIECKSEKCGCIPCKTYLHKSDCAVHNAPAAENGSCDCEPSSLVEEKIKFICEIGYAGDLRRELRELVALVRDLK